MLCKQTSSAVVEARCSKLAHARAKGSVWNDQGTTCASMVAGQEEGLVAPEVVDKIKDEFKDVFEAVDACPPARGGVDHVIRLQQKSSPSFMRPFLMSKHEEDE